MLLPQEFGWLKGQPLDKREVKDLEQHIKVKKPLVALFGAVYFGLLGSSLPFLSNQSVAQESFNSPAIKSSRHRTQSFIWPTQGIISQNFNYNHAGIDIAGSMGTPIYAAAAGQIIDAGWDGFLGNRIKIQHADGTVTVYGHNQRLLVRKGQYVQKGTPIAQMGSTGNSTGPHLHFEVRVGGSNWDWANPREFLPPLVAGQIPSQKVAINQPQESQAAVVASMYRVEIKGTSYSLLEQVRTVVPGAFPRRREGVIQAGVFSQEFSAQRRMRELAARGIAAHVVAVAR